ncbi:MAG: FMN-binding protein [Acidimicrobiales bacterium]|jgi:uncharacterized protein with FMN-binding domain
MRRAHVVAVATVAGLAGVLSFHTKSAPLGLGKPLSAAPGSSSTSVPTSRAGGSGGTGAPGPTTTSPAPSTAPPATRTATGAAVNYNYGVLSVAATVSGTKLTNVTIASIDEGGNFRSQSIDQQAVPILEQEALQAQSANIQGVSGASYTSAGFEQSLQSALTQLGFR